MQKFGHQIVYSNFNVCALPLKIKGIFHVLISDFDVTSIKLLNITFATIKNICYFENAPAKSGVGVRSPFNYHRHLTFTCYGGLLRAALVAGRSCGYGTSNPLWLTSIRFEANVGGLVKLTAGNTMNILWCLLSGVCHGISYAFFNCVVFSFLGLEGAER